MRAVVSQMRDEMEGLQHSHQNKADKASKTIFPNPTSSNTNSPNPRSTQKRSAVRKLSTDIVHGDSDVDIHPSEENMELLQAQAASMV